MYYYLRLDYCNLRAMYPNLSSPGVTSVAEFIIIIVIIIIIIIIIIVIIVIIIMRNCSKHC